MVKTYKKGEEPLKIKTGQSLALLKDLRVGVVRYYDKVKFAGGTWFGLELLNAPGSHNGTVKGRRYFRAKKENQGIFVKRPAIEEILKKKPTKEQLEYWGRQYRITEEIYAGGDETQWFRKREIEHYLRCFMEFERAFGDIFSERICASIIQYMPGIDVVGKFQLKHGLLQCFHKGTWEMTDRKTKVRGSGTWTLHRQQVKFVNGEQVKPDPWLAEQFFLQFTKKKSFVFKQNTVGNTQIMRTAIISMGDLDETRNLDD